MGFRNWIIVTCLLTANAFESFAQRTQFNHVEPPFWWTGMKHTQLEILFHSTSIDLTAYRAGVTYPGVTLEQQKLVENPHYVFLTLNISPEAKPGRIPITFRSGRKTIHYDYELKSRADDRGRAKGFGSEDVIYLIMPDRFSNGDTGNDSIPGMYEGVNRSKGGSRHGGDLSGINNNLEYLDNLGITALWLNPVLENNQRVASYHGYAITDLYQVDRRFGGNAAYTRLIDDCHRRGLKVIQDMVMNHLGNEHWLIKDLPSRDWVHQFPEFTRSNYRSTVLTDPYQAGADADKMRDGWFDTTMPDLNQRNPILATYLIQNTIWWIEYAGIDGIRMDTYPYPDKAFMASWAKSVLAEYPSFNIVGEVWINNVATTAYWQDGSVNNDGYRSYLPSVTDFPLFFTVPEALNESEGWDTGLMRLYDLLGQDFNYANPMNNVTFLDNHDTSRFFRLVNRDLRKFKMGLIFLLTTRGIPQLYYGSEILMDGDGGHHPDVRLDFPGGWPGDAKNAFVLQGRTPDQNDAVNFVRSLLQWRKQAKVIHNGTLTHFIPENNVYVYFRYDKNNTVMVVLNGNENDVSLNTHRFNEIIKNAKNAKDVLNDRIITEIDVVHIPAMSGLVLELQ